jgi:hypothetical protein
MRAATILREQHLGSGILYRVDSAMGLTVATEKSLQAQHIGRLQCSNQYRPAAAGLDMGDTAQDQCANYAFAELGLSDDQRSKALGGDQQYFEIIICFRIDQRHATGELSDLAAELSPPVVDNRHYVTKTVALVHLQRAV